MSNSSLGLRPTIVDLIFGQNLASSVIFVVVGAAVTAIAAQFVVPIYPVPVTGQTLAVLVVGMSLGAARGALAMIVYVAFGAGGLPVFGNASSGIDVLFGPSGGYIFGYIACAATVGFLAERHWDRSFLRAVAAATIGIVITFLAGILGIVLAFERLGIESTIQSILDSSVTPFLIGEAIKIIGAAALLSLSWKAVLRPRSIDQEAG